MKLPLFFNAWNWKIKMGSFLFNTTCFEKQRCSSGVTDGRYGVERNRSVTKEKYLQGDIYLLVFYGITARHANGIFLCISEPAHMACGVEICAHKMCLKTENYDIFYQIWKLKLKFTIKCQNQDERTSSLLPRRSLKAFYWIPKPVLKGPQDWKLIDKDILLTKPRQWESQKQQLKNENEIHLPVLAECRIQLE